MKLLNHHVHYLKRFELQEIQIAKILHDCKIEYALRAIADETRLKSIMQPSQRNKATDARCKTVTALSTATPSIQGILATFPFWIDFERSN